MGKESVIVDMIGYDEQGHTVYTKPGAPISWNDPQSPENPDAGYGYIADDTTDEETFFYHSDHLGSTSYITDDKGNITQYDAYLPYGELLVDEHSSSEEMPYKFNGKELDEETGLYYYGARYMQPMASIWYGLDALSSKKPALSGCTYCLGNPIRIIDPDGNWEWDKNGNLYAQKGDNAVSLSKFLGTNINNATTILGRVGVKKDKDGNITLKEGQIIGQKDLWVGYKSATGIVVNNTAEATKHYFYGNGEPADVGDITTKELLSSDVFRKKHKKITSEKVQSSGFFSVDLTSSTFHVGHTNVDYKVSDNGKSLQVTYTLFARDGFWDPDFIDEKVLGDKLNLKKFKPDGKGPNLERGGTPYDYKTRTRIYFFKPLKL